MKKLFKPESDVFFSNANINLFKLSFPQKIEEEYIQYYYDNKIIFFRLSIILIVFLNFISGFIDAYFAKDALFTILTIRYGLVFPFSIAILAASFFNIFQKNLQTFLCIFITAIGIFNTIFLLLCHADNPYLISTILVIMLGYSYSGANFISACIAGWSILYFYIFSCLFLSNASLMDISSNNFFFVISNIFGMFTSFTIEYHSRREFLIKILYNNEKNNVISSNDIKAKFKEKHEQLDFTIIKLRKDIKEKNETEKALRKSEEKYRTILDSIEQGYYEIDNDGNFIFVNDYMCDLLGRCKSEIIGINYTEIMDEKNAEKVSNIFNNISNSNIPDKGFIWDLIKGDGTLRKIGSSASLITDNKGIKKGYRGIARDVTERKRIEAQKQAKAGEESANKAKSEFLANMSYEIKSSLNSIIEKIEFGIKSKPDKDILKIFNAVFKGTNNLLNIINDILYFSKIESGKVSLEKIPFDIKELIDTVAYNISENSVQKNIEIINYLSPDIPSEVIGDPNRLKQIFMYLIGHILTFTQAEEIFLIGQPVQDMPESIKVKFQIKYNGNDIPYDKIVNIFKGLTCEDSSITSQYGRSVLETAICKQLAEMMNGEIGFDSDEKTECIFWFTAIFQKILTDNESQNSIEIDEFTKNINESSKNTDTFDNNDNNILSPPIDILTALEDFDNDKEFFIEAINEFLENVTKQIEIINQAIKDNDFEIIKQEANLIKKGAGNLICDDLSKAASELELLSKNEDIFEILEVLKNLIMEHNRLKKFIEEENII